jgi:hypothetical protein
MTQSKHYHLYEDLGDIFVNIDSYMNKINHMPDANGCLNWLGPWHRQGYGMIGAVRKSDDRRIMVTAHRVAGRIKAGRALATTDTVVHTCSNPACQNQDHILIGDLSLRNSIMHANGRASKIRKPREIKKQNRKYKYTDAEIVLLKTDTTTAIAQHFGWTKSQAAKQRWYARSMFKWLDEKETV